jgi:hypothetical protein
VIKLPYVETDKQIIDTVTLRKVKKEGRNDAGSIYFRPEIFERMNLPLGTSLQFVYNKDTNQICISALTGKSQ